MQQANRPPTLEEFQAWLQDPTTQAVYLLMQRWEEALKDQWANKLFQRSNSNENIMANADALGQLQVIQTFREMTFQQLTEGLTDRD